MKPFHDERDPASAKLYLMRKNPADLLDEFWQRSSDACPLEATEHEKQLNEFRDFANPHVLQVII